MNRKITSFLNGFSSDTNKIDRLIVSAFVIMNNISVTKNSIIYKLLITETGREYKKLISFINLLKESGTERLDLEGTIELFEVVISPKEKIVTGAVYTPEHIREFIVIQTMSGSRIENPKIADVACGCAGFLLTMAKYLKNKTHKRYSEIIDQNLYGLDIAEYSVRRSKIILSLLVLLEEEDCELKFNIFIGNALDYDWGAACDEISKNSGFDFIVGNPPYVCSRNIDVDSFKLLDKWKVAKSGHPDLYIPFFQIGLENLNSKGKLGYITVNTFFKSINGRALRGYLSDSKFALEIIDFKNEQVFKKRSTYTCICLVSKNKKRDYVNYIQTNSKLLNTFNEKELSKNSYKVLDDFNGWNLGKEDLLVTIKKIESLDLKLFTGFGFSTGIATLKNNIYKFSHYKEDSIYYYFQRQDFEYKVEKAICRTVINSNKVKSEKELDSLKERIIFPYRWNENAGKYSIIKEVEFRKLYPKAHSYLLANQSELSKRDKQKREYEEWYAYGRNQSLNIKGVKLFFPHITKSPSFVLSEDENLLFYNGEAIVSQSKRDLKVLKRILESEIFLFYIKKTSKPYSSGYFSLGKNYIKQFSIPELSAQEKSILLHLNADDLLAFLLKKYDLKKEDIL